MPTIRPPASKPVVKAPTVAVPAAAAPKPKARVAVGDEFSSGRGSALRTRALSVSGAAAAPAQSVTAPQPSSLLTERLGDGQANCLERAYASAGPNDAVTLLHDSRDPIGHAVVQRATGQVFDPATGQGYASMTAYLAQNAHYALRPEPEARNIPRSTLERVFQSAPHSSARTSAIAAAGLTNIAQLRVADGGPLTAQEASAEIKRLLHSNPLDDVTHGDLMAIEAVLRRVPADQINAVVASLSDAELTQWVADLSDPGVLGHGPFRGLDSTERSSVFALLANNLLPSQAGRFFEALDQPEQMVQFGEAFLAQADVHDRLGFLMVIGDATFPDGERGASAHIIASALDALTTDPGRLGIAIGTLSNQNLDDALIAASGARWSNGPFGGQPAFQNLDRLQRLIDAVATTNNHSARAAVFEGLGTMMTTLIRAGVEVQNLEAVADQVTGMMTSLLSDELPAVLAALGGTDGIDPVGTALTAYARELLRDGGGALGALTQQLDALDLEQPGVEGRYDNAFIAGYFAGAVFKALDTLTPSDLLGPDWTMALELVKLVVSFRADPASGMLLGGAISEAERAGIDRAMNEGGRAVRAALLDLLGVELSPGNDNGTGLGGFEQGLFAVYGAELYGD